MVALGWPGQQRATFLMEIFHLLNAVSDQANFVIKRKRRQKSRCFLPEMFRFPVY